MAAATRDILLPRPPGGMGAGAMLALLVHAGLIAALAFSVRWRTSVPEGIEAELWAAVPQVAAPAPVRAAAPEPLPKPVPEPPKPPPEPTPVPRAEPPPPDPQIAIEREKAERDRTERAERAERRETEKLAQLREENLRRAQELAGGATPGTGTAAFSAGPSASYAGRIKARIKPNIVFTETPAGNPVATVEVRAAPDGTIVGRRLVKSSGLAAWDEAVLRAIDKTEVLPRDTDGRVPSPIEIEFRVRE